MRRTFRCPDCRSTYCAVFPVGGPPRSCSCLDCGQSWDVDQVGALADTLFQIGKTAAMGVASVYAGPAGAVLVNVGADAAKAEVDKATGHNQKKKKKPRRGPAKRPPVEKTSQNKKVTTEEAKQNSEVVITVDPKKKELVLSNANREEDNTGALILRPQFSIQARGNPATAVLPGKPNPVEYGAIYRNGRYVWPNTLTVRVNGRMIPRKLAMQRYQNALRSWTQRNAVYARSVSTRGVDAAARLAARAAASRMAALETRIAELEAQIQQIGTEPTEWMEEGAYYEQPEFYGPGEYYDDEGFYGEFDGMSGSDGDLGYARKFGEWPDDVGASGDDEDRTSGGDDMGGGIPVDLGDQNLGDADDGGVGAGPYNLRRPPPPPPRGRYKQPRRPPVQGRRVTFPPPPRFDQRDQIIAELKQKNQQLKRDRDALSNSLAQAGRIVGSETAARSQRVAAYRMSGDGLQGEENRLPPPPPAPSNLGGNDENSYPSGVNLSGGAPKPPPAPSDDDLGGDGCIPCQMSLGNE